MEIRYAKQGVRQMRGDGIRGTNVRSASGLSDLIGLAASGRESITVAEIGSYAGESAAIMLGTGLVSRIYCIDPWMPYSDTPDSDMAAVEAEFDRRHGMDTRVVKVKGTVDTFIEGVASGVYGDVDLVYIDGCHSYGCVTHDIQAAFYGLRPGAGIGLHGYNVRGLRDAVHTLLGEPARLFSDTSCYFQTPDALIVPCAPGSVYSGYAQARELRSGAGCASLWCTGSEDASAGSPVYVLTPTGDRRWAFSLCVEYMNRQTRPPDMWVIVDDGSTESVKSQLSRITVPYTVVRLSPMRGNSLVRNLREAVRAIPDTARLCIMEDDDWYPADYLETMAGLLLSHDFVGTALRRCYSVSTCSFRIWSNESRMALHGQGYARAGLRHFRNIVTESPDGQRSLDYRLCGLWSGGFGYNVTATPVHIVGMSSGRDGTTVDHRITRDNALWTEDNGHAKLIEWIGDDVSNYYEGPVDAVFVIGSGSTADNEELRYALRCVERNCPFVRRVYIVGECPAWIDRSALTHVPWPERFRHAKDANIVDKLREACETPGIARRILFCSDDQFVTRVCSWHDFAPRWLRVYRPDDSWYSDMGRGWYMMLRGTLERERLRRIELGMSCDDIYYWEPHIYSPIDRDLFIEYAKWCGYETRDDTITQSGYYNYVRQRGQRTYDHTYVAEGHDWSRITTHIAYFDGSTNTAMRYLRHTFPERSRFELPGSAAVPVFPSFGEGVNDSRWSRFDFVAIRVFAPNSVRAVSAAAELSRAGLRSVTPFWGAPTPYTNVIERGVKHNSTAVGPHISITLGHQQMIRAAYDSGSRFALIMEDDVKFSRDITRLYAALDSLPADTDIGLFDWLPPTNASDEAVSALTAPGALWRRFTDLRSTACYCLSQRAMSALLDVLERPALARGTLKTIDQLFWDVLHDGRLVGYYAYPNPAAQPADARSTSQGVNRRYARIGVSPDDYGPAGAAAVLQGGAR